MMKVTFPHMGNVYIAGKAFLEELGTEVVTPPRTSKKTLDLGAKYSPESICMPFKINIGNYIEAIEKGADTILITGSCGPCRFGYYNVLEKAILNDLGYEDVDLIVYDHICEGTEQLKEALSKTLNITSYKSCIKAAKMGWKLISEADSLTKHSNIKRAYAKESYLIDIIMDEYYERIDSVHGSEEMLKLIKDTRKKLDEVKIDENKNPIRIGIVGEIYTMLEPFVNLELERKLGHMGVVVDISLTPTNWVEHHVLRFPFGSKHENMKYKYARPYVKTLVGGHGRESVGAAALYALNGYDGVIHLLPLNCMPEIVAKAILPSVEKDYDIPIMTLVVDEMTGEAGYLTRLEAFVDLLTKRREDKNGKKMLHGC
jgi:predicted nucleotide-binding protein (sugar kinase/HSP70/actin superfamily)